MTIVRMLAGRMALTVAITVWFCGSPRAMQAQDYEGWNVVYGSSNAPALSRAFIDATPYYTSNGNDICVAINKILTDPNYPSTGAVVDARGAVPSSAQTAVTCTINPFAGVSAPSVVLLPAANIDIAVPWVLPDSTRVMGGGPFATSLVASSPIGDMIDMGTAQSNCTTQYYGISVEHLSLVTPQTSNQLVNGIVNDCAQESSFVDDVGMRYVLGTGLTIKAVGSGPYSNISFTCGNGQGGCLNVASIHCVDIQAATRGLHGITCNSGEDSNGNAAFSGILLDGNDNSIEDVHLEGFNDGVLIGSRYSAQGNVLLNVKGGHGAGPLTNVVHVCNPNNPSGNCPAGSGTVSDLALLQIESYYTGTVPILDDVTQSEPTAAPSSTQNAYVGMYVLGNNCGQPGGCSNGGQTAGYSRFTTSPGPNLYSAGTGVPTLAVGSTVPASGSTCVQPGVVYANTTGQKGSSNTLFVCVSGVWQNIGM